jgi:serine/threonine-protein kinase
MVLEYLEGADLAQVLTRQGRLPVAIACNYVVQACEAVAEAHANGIVHRDLKPENLYLTTSLGGADHVKVLDFGVSKTLTADRAGLTSTGVAVGSPVYMAPEQVRGSREIGPRTDVWGLGVVLYELLTEAMPFEAESLPDLCMKIANEPPISLASRRADVPAALAAVVARCLEKDPVKRYFDAADLAEALAPFAQSLVRSAVSQPRIVSVDSTSMTLAAPMPPPVSRRPRRRGWALGLAIAAAAAGAWLALRPASRVEIALAAADAARSVSLFAQQPTERLEPEVTRAAGAAAPAATAPSTSATPASTTAPARAQGTTRPARTLAAPAQRAQGPDDDIPAFR